MPNWCDNSVTLRHTDKSKIDALVAEMSKKNDEGRSMAEPFNHLRPNPAGEWDYNWSVENWGTKWEASIIDWDHTGDNEVMIWFESAWSPPTALYEYLVEEGWEVEAIYQESGMGYAGQFTNELGDDYFEYDLSDPESIERLPEDVIEFGDLRNRSRDWLIDQMAEEWGDAERTDWIPVETAPVRDGWYEIQTKGWEFAQFCEYKDGCWDNYNDVTKWRGLAKNPEENVE